MKYTIEDMEKEVSEIVAGLADMRRAKGHDYSGTEDTLDNLREFGSFGTLAVSYTHLTLPTTPYV